MVSMEGGLVGLEDDSGPMGREEVGGRRKKMVPKALLRALSEIVSDLSGMADPKESMADVASLVQDLNNIIRRCIFRNKKQMESRGRAEYRQKVSLVSLCELFVSVGRDLEEDLPLRKLLGRWAIVRRDLIPLACVLDESDDPNADKAIYEIAKVRRHGGMLFTRSPLYGGSTSHCAEINSRSSLWIKKITKTFLFRPL